jgi:hypothetical protein
MKISDKGLHEILSLGLKKETSVVGVYFLYEWDDVKYLAVPNIDVALPAEYPGAVKILLTPEQYALLEGPNVASDPSKPKTSILDSEDFNSTTEYFENLILLNFDKNQKVFSYKEAYGSNTMLKNFKCAVDNPSPLKILFDTKKPFHGKYHPISNFDEVLRLVNIETQDLWISAYPLLKNQDLVGAVIAFSNKTAVNADVLESFKDAESKYLQALGL